MKLPGVEDQDDAALDKLWHQNQGPQPPGPEQGLQGEEGAGQYEVPKPKQLPLLWDRSMKARAAGATWKQIKDGWNTRINAARQAGATEEQIQLGLGFNPSDPHGFEKAMTFDQRMQDGATPEEHRTYGQAWDKGYRQRSASGAVEGNAPAEVMPHGMEEEDDISHQLVNSFGKEAGDLYYQVLGMVGGYAMGGHIGAAVGYGALPAAVRAEAVEKWLRGDYRGGRDIAERQVNIAYDAISAGLQTAAMMAGGEEAAFAAEQRGAGQLGQLGAKTVGAAAALEASKDVIEGHLPTPQSIIDTGINVAGFYGMDIGAARIIGNNAMKLWGRTGEPLAKIQERALKDPGFAQTLMADDSMPHKSPPMSITVKTGDSDGALHIDRSDKADGHASSPSTANDNIKEGESGVNARELGEGHTGGTVTLPGDDQIFHWGSGSPGRYAAIPPGDYPITPEVMGDWGKAHGAIGINNNAIFDPQLGRMRGGIEIHAGSGTTIDTLQTKGCFAIPREEYPEFKRKLLAATEKGTVYLHIGVDGKASFDFKPKGGYSEINPANHSILSQGSTFEDGLSFILRTEGKYTTDSGGKTAFGISEHAYPDEFKDGKRPTRERAIEIYHEIWNRMEIEKLPADMRLSVFDAAVNEGEPMTKRMLEASGGDRATFNRLRKAHYDRLIAENPDKYLGYKKSWYRRLAESSGNIIPDASSPDFFRNSTREEAEPSKDPVDVQVDKAHEETWSKVTEQDMPTRAKELERQLSHIMNEEPAGSFFELRSALSTALHNNPTPETVDAALQWAKENDRRDIAQMIVDRAANRVPRDPGTPEEGAPPQLIELKRLYDEKKKEAEDIAKKAGLQPKPMKERSEPKVFSQIEFGDARAGGKYGQIPIDVEKPANSNVESNDNIPVRKTSAEHEEEGTTPPIVPWHPVDQQHFQDLQHQWVANARTGIPWVDQLLNHPVISNVIANAKFNWDYTTPWTASGSVPENDPTTYIGNHVPKALKTEDGKTFSVEAPIAIHENTELGIMDRLIKRGWDPQDAYEVAHWAATQAEHAYYRFIGIDPALAEKAWKPVIETGLLQTDHNFPPNAYRDTGQFDSTGHGLKNEHEPNPTPEMLAQAEKDMAHAITEDQEGAPRQGYHGYLPVSGKAGPPTPMRKAIDKRRAAGQASVTSHNPEREAMTPREIMLSHLDQKVDDGLFNDKTARQALAEIYTDLFKETHPIVQVAQAMRNSLRKGGQKLLDRLDPEIVRVWANALPNKLTQHYFVTKGAGPVRLGRDADGNIDHTLVPMGGKSLKDIYAPLNVEQKKDLLSLTVAHFIVNAHEMGRATWDADVEHARSEIARLTVPDDPTQANVKWEDVFNRAGAQMPKIVMPRKGVKSQQMTDLIKNGPHYNSDTMEIVTHHPDDFNYEEQMAPGVTLKSIIDHEMGHAIAHQMGKLHGMDVEYDEDGNVKLDTDGLPIGINPHNLSLLKDEMVIANYQFRPEMVNAAPTATPYWHSPAELMADATAHYILHPEVRWLMPEFAKMMGPEFEKFAPMLGPEEVGNPVSRAMAYQVALGNSTLRMLRDGGFMTFDRFRQQVAAETAGITGYRSMHDRAQEAYVAGRLPPGSIGSPQRGSDRAVDHNPIFRPSEGTLRLANIQQGLAKDVMIRVRATLDNLANIPLVDAMGRLGWAQRVGKAVYNMTEADLARLSNGDLEGSVNSETPALWRLIDRAPKPGQIPVFRDGHIEIWEVTKEHQNVVEAVRNMDNKVKNKIIKFAEMYGDFERAQIIANPKFGARNTWFDVLMTPLTKGVNIRQTMHMFYDGISSVMAHYTGLGEEHWHAAKDDLWKRWELSGGPQSMMGKQIDQRFVQDMLHEMDPDYQGTRALVLSAKNAIKTPFRIFQFYTEVMSEIMSVGRFAHEERMGSTPLRAQVESNQQVFHTAGGGRWITQWRLNRLEPFFNVAFKNMDQIGRSMVGQGPKLIADGFHKLGIGPGGEALGLDNVRLGKPIHAKQFWLTLLVTHTIPAALAWWMYKDEDWYNNAPLSTLMSSIPVKTGDSVRWIPMLPGISAIAIGGPLAILDHAYRTEPHHFASNIIPEFAKEMVPQFPGLGSSIMGKMFNMAHNYSGFRDQPITTESEAKRSPQYQFGPNTTEFAKMLGGATGKLWDAATPNNIQYFLDQVVPIVGQAERNAEAVGRYFGLAKQKPLGDDASKLPWISAWTAQDTVRNRPYEITHFNEAMKQDAQVHEDLISAIKTHNEAMFDQVVRDNPEQAAMHGYHLTQDYKSRMELAGDSAASMRMLDKLARLGQLITPEQAQMYADLKGAEKYIQRAKDDVSLIYSADLGNNPEERLKLLSDRYDTMKKWANVALPIMTALHWRGR